MTLQSEITPPPAPVWLTPAKRPGGLTALAVVNFVLGALGLVATAGFVFFLLLADGLQLDMAVSLAATDAAADGAVSVGISRFFHR